MLVLITHISFNTRIILVFPFLSSGLWPTSHIQNHHVLGPRGLVHPPHWRRARVQIISLKEERAEYKGRPECLKAKFIKIFWRREKLIIKAKIYSTFIWIVLRVRVIWILASGKQMNQCLNSEVLFSGPSKIGKVHSCSSSDCLLLLTLPAATSWDSNLIFFQLLVVYRFTHL